VTNGIYTYDYSQAYDPPFPVIEITLSLPGQVQNEATFTALIDSGSDGTLIPLDILEGMGARYVDQARIRSILGDSRLVNLYLVSLGIGPHQIPAVRAIAAVEGQEIILGRDILNQLVITLNGPASVSEIPV
jgi:predicted aspartyl protease